MILGLELPGTKNHLVVLQAHCEISPLTEKGADPPDERIVQQTGEMDGPYTPTQAANFLWDASTPGVQLNYQT
jgi:hypothetical protein